ncbi:helix-turn-helix domain-containing protein [Aneurinibacillus soli]|uniref:Helix-turn-helix domain protein n=1 Tax=Aneurinibacillus soli TaxID=1500254 RepID=A0A0U5B3T9_9BACL|nr:helix-turn-helix domain-containing protein [Aneurinibacillus soli]BAU29024.1 Helix-turn-helix domain protein [Aneurinibacillus soli]
MEIAFCIPSTEEEKEIDISSTGSVCVTPASNDQLTLEEKNTDKDMLTVEETAELLRVSKPAVYKWIRNKQIDFIPPAINNGKGYLIPKAQFEARLKRMEAYKLYY